MSKSHIRPLAAVAFGLVLSACEQGAVAPVEATQAAIDVPTERERIGIEVGAVEALARSDTPGLPSAAAAFDHVLAVSRDLLERAHEDAGAQRTFMRVALSRLNAPAPVALDATSRAALLRELTDLATRHLATTALVQAGPSEAPIAIHLAAAYMEMAETALASNETRACSDARYSAALSAGYTDERTAAQRTAAATAICARIAAGDSPAITLHEPPATPDPLPICPGGRPTFSQQSADALVQALLADAADASWRSGGAFVYGMANDTADWMIDMGGLRAALVAQVSALTQYTAGAPLLFIRLSEINLVSDGCRNIRHEFSVVMLSPEGIPVGVWRAASAS